MALKLEVDGGLIKPANYEHEYTPEQLIELARCAGDPCYFIRTYLRVIHPTKGLLQFALYDYQERMIRAYVAHSRVITMAPRQTGKSTLAAAFLLWWCCFKENQNILVASNKGRGALEIMTRFKQMYESLPWWIKPGVKVNNVFSMKFDNGNFIEGTTTTENTGRGLSLSLLYLDEFAKVRPTIQDAFYTSVLPTLSTGGRLIITSTPDTDEDKFAQIWMNARDADGSYRWTDEALKKLGIEVDKEEYDTAVEVGAPLHVVETMLHHGNKAKAVDFGFTRFFVHWMEHPERDDAFKRSIIAQGVTETEWQREFECVFAGQDASLIHPIKLLSLNATVRKPRLIDKHGGLWFDEIRPNTPYFITIDPSEGNGQNNAAIQVWSMLGGLRQVAEWASNTADQIEQAKMLVRYMKRIFDTQQSDPEHIGQSEIYYSVECNGIGVGVLNPLLLEGEERFPGYLIDSYGNKGRGLRTSATSKLQFCMQLKKLIERGVFVPASRFLVSELKDFVKRGRSYEAKQGTSDDRVMSCVLMLHLLDEVKFHVDGIEESMHVNVTDYSPDDPDDPENMPMPPII